MGHDTSFDRIGLPPYTSIDTDHGDTQRAVLKIAIVL